MSELDGGGSGVSVLNVDGGAGDSGDDAGDFEAFDRGAALEQASKVMDGEEPEAAPEAAPEPEKTPEELTDEERQANRRKKLSDDKGKLDQDKLDNAFAKLTAEGKRLRAKAEAHKAERAQFDEAKARYDAAINQAAERVNAKEAAQLKFDEEMKTSPLGALERAGWTVEKLVKWIQNDGKSTPEDMIESTRADYDKRFTEQQAKLAELEANIQKRQFEAVARSYQEKATRQMAELMPQYELVSKYDLQTEVAPKILQKLTHIYREGGELNDVKYPKGTALDPKVVLDHFEAQEAKQLARFGFRPGQAGAANSAAKPGASQPKALSNSDTSSRSVKPPSDDDGEFDREAAWREVQRVLNS
jgi:hypothetical protein